MIKTDHRRGQQAAKILSMQNPDGTWGSRFHALSVPDRRQGLMTTEQALRRLKILGFTIEDEPIRRAVDCMRACLRGERKIDDYWEKGHDWALFTRMMLSAWVLEFSPEPEALEFAQSWARVIEEAFKGGGYDDNAYRAAYVREFDSPIRGGRERDFVDFYHVSLLKGQLSKETESRFLDYVMGKPEGIYYICNGPVSRLPGEFASRETVSYLGAAELLLGYGLAAGKLGFVADWLEGNRSPEGLWDLGPKARDGIHLPLSDSWRGKGARQADCTEWVSGILDRLYART